MSLRFSPDSLKLTRSLAFKQLLRELTPQISHMREKVLEVASKEPFETIRYTAGRLDGALYLLGMLEKAKEMGDAQKEQAGST